jgi:hypothetical protein
MAVMKPCTSNEPNYLIFDASSRQIETFYSQTEKKNTRDKNLKDKREK